MGAMLTFASYLSKHENLNREAAIISFSDFGVAFIAGLVVFPVIAALGLQDQVGESTVGALFISLPGAFVAMGSAGRVVGTFFFLALVVGALTSAISLLEVVVSSMIDEFKLARKSAALIAGVFITVLGILPATNLDILGAMDAVAGEFFLVVGALGMAVLVGWVMKNPQEELLDGASPGFAKAVPAVLFFLRFIAPVILVIVIWNKAASAWTAIGALVGGP
jgi:NSS family neurotransmitter:Na+ symporter